MSDRSKIEWTDASWNPLRARKRGGQVGDPAWRNNLPGGKGGWHCEHISEGCRHCYAESINRRLGTGLDYKPGYRADLEFFLDEKTLVQPLHWKKPRKIFPGSMTDLFGDWVTDAQLDRIFAVMALCPQHTFQPLTKRAERMRAYWIGEHGYRDVHPLEDRINNIADAAGRLMEDGDNAHDCVLNLTWPLPNVWFGVSCEDQPTWDERTEHLRKTPAAVRFVSAEPLLSGIEMRLCETALGFPAHIDRHGNAHDMPHWLHWLICGGESGANARPMHPDWARSLRDQCKAAGVAFFFKQWGAFAPAPPIAGRPDLDEMPAVERVGKKRAGRLLDGVEHNGFPQIAKQSEAA